MLKFHRFMERRLLPLVFGGRENSDRLHREVYHSDFGRWIRRTFPGITKWINR